MPKQERLRAGPVPSLGPGDVPNFAPCQIMHPLVLVGLGVGVGGGVRIRQSGSDFKGK